MTNIIELERVTKQYGNHVAVDQLSLNIRKGEVFGLLGPNGAGKSTTVSMLSTVLSPTSGDIRIDGKSLRSRSREAKRVMGIVPQELALYQTLSARDNLSFFGSLYGLTGKALQARVGEVLDLIELADKANQNVNEYSGGMKRRLNIGIALMNKPSILVLDEPTVGIDPQSRNHILESVKALNEREGMTVIYTSHYMEEVEYLCDRVGIVDHGKLIAIGTKEELKHSVHAGDRLTITCNGDAPVNLGDVMNINGVMNASIHGETIQLTLSSECGDLLDIMGHIKALGISVKAFQFEEVNLESLFLQITGKKLRE